MLYKIANSFPDDMIFKDEGPLISLYQPTHRFFPENKQDPIVYKNLLREVENSLKKKTDADIDLIMKPFYQLQDDRDFWNNTLDGIAVLASKNNCIVYRLHNQVQELAVVANSFHIKPLLRAFQAVDNYQLLGLDRENFSLYQGNRFSFQELKLPEGTPRTMKEVLGRQLDNQSYISHGDYGGAEGSTFHGHGDVQEEIDIDTEKFFRYVDDFVLENYSKVSKLPLILVALKEYHSQFKSLSNNPYLIEEGIDKSLKSLKLDEIEKRARVIIDKINMENKQKLAESYAQAAADELGSADLVEVVKAAFEGRVQQILIQEDKVEAGKIDYSTGKIKACQLENPNCDDILDDLAELVLSYGGTVLVLPLENMPTTTGIAAVYRHN